MYQKYLEKIEYNKILSILEDHCRTYMGADLVQNTLPSTNKTEIENLLSETEQATNLIIRKGSLPISEISDIDIWIKNLKSFNTLSAKALLDVAGVLKTSRLLHEYFFADDSFNISEFKNLQDYFSMLYFNKDLENLVFKSIIDENTISDDASPKLSSLRRTRKNLEQAVRDKLSNFIHSSTYSKYVMDAIITIRNDRFVIPVKDEAKNQISGSIIDVSASGSTVYIEPSIVFDLNNKINNIKIEENIEIEKILKNISLRFFPVASNIESALAIIGKLDFIFARASYSRSIDGEKPNLNDEKFISLICARHPLINKDKVVPIDVTLGKDYTSLLITGPNTGGKTVTLKTTGLLCAMAYSGILIPAKSTSSICVFDNIFADIGDEQSIQESLSTFSSHMTNIVDILKKANSNSLVLLDELGSGTDPLEGASLAISVLERLHSIGALTICTTHYPELKKYALVTDGFENASSDFDIENLRPTYKLLIGVPGKSNAFAISKKIGLDDDILSRAKSFLKEDDVSIETVLKNIYDYKLEIEAEKEKILKNSNQIELLRKSLERDNSKLDLEAKLTIENAKNKAKEILLEAKEEANFIIKELNTSNISASKANSLRNKLNSDINTMLSSKPVKNKTISVSDIQVGQKVFNSKLSSEATILSLPNKSNEVKIQVGFMTMNAKLSDLTILSAQKEEKHNSKASYSNNKAKSVSSEINVIGLTVDEAIPIVDKYIDDCYMAGLEQARIVHGKGTGKLRAGIQSYLKKHPHVKTFRPGTFGEGEMGVTVISLK